VNELSSERLAALMAVPADVLACLLGITPKEIYDLTKAGALERGAGKLFELESNLRRYCEHVRGRSANMAQAAE